MEMFKGYFFLLLVIHIHNPSRAIKDLYDTGKKLWELYSMMNNMNINTTHNVNGFLSDETLTYQEVRQRMYEIHKEFDQMEKFMSFMTIHHSFTSFDIMLYKSISTLEIFILSINDYYEQIHRFMNESDFYPHPFPNSTQTILTIEEEIRMIRNIIGSSGEASNAPKMLSTITSFATTQQTQLYDISRPISSTLVELFRIVMIAEMKANIISAYVRIQKIDNTVGWMNLYTRDEFEMYFGIYVNIFAVAIRTVEEVYLRACEPDDGFWIRNENFYELEGTFQATIFRYSWMKCKFDNCNDVWFEKPSECDVGYYDDRSGCSGTSAQCAYLGAIQACILKTGPYKFQYLNSTERGVLGENLKCPEHNGYIIEHGSGWDFTTGTCACNCYRNHNKISLMIMESRGSVNMVIIGLRFVRRDGILYVQPREGKLDAHGYIHLYSERWIPIRKNSRTPLTHSINREHRVFFLDDLRLDPGYVLTGGVGIFHKGTEGYAGFISLRVYGIKYGQYFTSFESYSEKGGLFEHPQGN